MTRTGGPTSTMNSNVLKHGTKTGDFLLLKTKVNYFTIFYQLYIFRQLRVNTDKR